MYLWWTVRLFVDSSAEISSWFSRTRPASTKGYGTLITMAPWNYGLWILEEMSPMKPTLGWTFGVVNFETRRNFEETCEETPYQNIYTKVRLLNPKCFQAESRVLDRHQSPPAAGVWHLPRDMFSMLGRSEDFRCMAAWIVWFRHISTKCIKVGVQESGCTTLCWYCMRIDMTG